MQVANVDTDVAFEQMSTPDPTVTTPLRRRSVESDPR